MRLLRRGIVLITLGLVACGGDSTGPGATANVTGTWSGTVSNLSGSGVVCQITGATITLSQSGATFTGTYTNALISCTANGQTQSGLTAGSIVNGKVTGTAVEFDFDTPDAHATGTISGNSMSGSTTFRINTGSTTVNLVGQWSAARQTTP